MANTSQPVLVVLGYGCHLSVRMQNYLDTVLAYARKHKPIAVITTGGFTNQKSAPGVSEATMMKRYLEHNGLEAPVYTDETACSTVENLRNSAGLLLQHGLHQHPVVVFCNRAHAAKVAGLAWLYLTRMPTIKTYALSRDMKTYLDQLFVATPLTLLATQVEWLERREMRRKERMMAVS